MQADKEPTVIYGVKSSTDRFGQAVRGLVAQRKSRCFYHDGSTVFVDMHPLRDDELGIEDRVWDFDYRLRIDTISGSSWNTVAYKRDLKTGLIIKMTTEADQITDSEYEQFDPPISEIIEEDDAVFAVVSLYTSHKA